MPLTLLALVALSAVLACATDRPGARCVTTLLAIFFAFFLLIGPPASALPPNAAIKAMTAMTSAGDCLRIMLFIPSPLLPAAIPDQFQVGDPPLPNAPGTGASSTTRVPDVNPFVRRRTPVRRPW